jgi:hypothetical protein
MIFAISLADRREAPSLALGVFDAQQQGCGVEQRRAGCSVVAERAVDAHEVAKGNTFRLYELLL